MGEKAGLDQAEPTLASKGDAAAGFWAHVQEHKIIQWGVGYLGAALALAHGQELVGHAFHWPDALGRIFMVGLIAGFPVALTLAWYHGHRGLKRVSAGELAIISVLLLIGAMFFTVALRPAADRTEEASALDEHPAAPSPVVQPRLAAEQTPSAPLPNSIAVLPFDNLSPDPNDAFFAVGLHDELLNQLGKLKSLNPIARTTVMEYARSGRPITQIGRELNVETFMEGSVSYAEGQIAVRAQLIDAQTGVNLWSESYNRAFADIFAIQADVSMNIANALNAEFSADEQQRIETPLTNSTAAYGLYLRALDLQGSSGQMSRMQEILDQAIAIDPGFAAAYGTKALFYAQQLTNTPEGPAKNWDEIEPLIREFADKALALNPAEPRALGALAARTLFSWRWTEARQAIRHAREVSDFSGGAIGAWFMAWSGNQPEALAASERWMDLRPLEWFAHWSHAVTLTYAGDYEAASTRIRDGLALAPAVPQQHSWLALVQMVLGNTSEARRELQLAEQLLGEFRTPIVLADAAYIYGRIGDRENARRLFDDIMAAAQRGEDVGAGGWALAYLAVGDFDDALEWLELGAEKARRHEPDAGFLSLMNLRMNYAADPVLERPEFVDVRNRLRGD